MCSYNFIKFSKCNYNFNVAVRISINQGRRKRKLYRNFLWKMIWYKYLKCKNTRYTIKSEKTKGVSDMDAKMLDGKTAIITGASYGMGRSMAELFAEEGANVVITARHQEKLDEVVEAIREKGGKAIGVVADVCSTEDTKKVFDAALKEFGDVDILINNAGIGEQKMIDRRTMNG